MKPQFADVHFPKAGIDLSTGFVNQPVRVLNDGSRAATCRQGVNVRVWEPNTLRARGCSRPGLSKYNPELVSGEFWAVQELTTLVAVGVTPIGSHAVQLSQSGRIVHLVAVSQGDVFFALPGDVEWTQTVNSTGETPPLNISGLVYSTALNQKLFFVDGTNYVYFDPADGSTHLWTASAGTMPADSQGNYARLVCTWRGRIVLAGLINDPQNWFMSAVGDPNDFNYDPVPSLATQAVAGNNSALGLVGDVITALIPYSDDLLIFGGDHSIYVMSGDPAAGGQIDLVSDITGMAFGMPWCKDPYGTLYFFSNRTGIYTLVPGQIPMRISQPIEQLLFGVNTGTNSIRMLWDDRFQGVHVFVTPLAAPSPTSHLFYEARNGAWWIDRFASTDFDPLCCCIFDGNEADDRVGLIGCWDGYVRALDPLATLDDYLPIESYVILGPILTANLDEMRLNSLQTVLSTLSGEVKYEIFVGETAEEALTNEPSDDGVLSAGRNATEFVRLAGHAIYIKLSASTPWAMESMRTAVQTLGKIRMRS